MLAGDMTKQYCCDSKYENIIFELGRRGWSLLPESDSVPSTCSLLWKNLSKIGWGGIFDRYVNHIRGSQHMSNKVRRCVKNTATLTFFLVIPSISFTRVGNFSNLTA